MKVHIFSFALLALLAMAYASECPAENGDVVVHLPNPEDCGTYYKCNEGEAVLLKCPSGLQWNAVLEVCDWPENAGCGAEAVEK